MYSLIYILQSDGRTHHSIIRTASGGVARNMAEALAKLQNDPLLVSVIGNDLFGREILHQLRLANMVFNLLKDLLSINVFI